jgi:hypothetical protein
MAYTGYHPPPVTADQLLERSDLVVGGVVDAVDAESGNKVYQKEEAKGLADPNHQRSKMERE